MFDACERFSYLRALLARREGDTDGKAVREPSDATGCIKLISRVIYFVWKVKLLNARKSDNLQK